MAGDGNKIQAKCCVFDCIVQAPMCVGNIAVIMDVSIKSLVSKIIYFPHQIFFYESVNFIRQARTVIHPVTNNKPPNSLPSSTASFFMAITFQKESQSNGSTLIKRSIPTNKLLSNTTIPQISGIDDGIGRISEQRVMIEVTE